MLLKDPHKFLSLNQDDTPAKLSPEEVTDAFNLRMGSSSEDQQSGQAETLQAEISVPISPDASIVYYGQPIGGQFLYQGYSEIAIGSQVWMAKNWDAQYPGSKVYDDDEDNRAIYGGLYTHNQAMSADFCPLGWHVPTEADINTLLTYLGGLLVGGGHLKEVGESHWNDPNLGADDSFGFRALPGGKFDMLYDLLGSKCLLWLQDDAAPLPPIAFPAVNITYNSFKANWSQSDGADGYDIDVSYYGGPIGWKYLLQNFNVGNVLNYILSNLLPSTDYSYLVRAYNEIGISGNSNTAIVKTLPLPVAVTDIDGNVYHSVIIGNQEWLVENLMTTHYKDGTAIPNLIAKTDWLAEDGSVGHDGAYCYYNNDITNKPIYGALYNWYAAINPKGIAPVGWRVPTLADIQELDNFAGGTPNAGGKLKEIGTIYWTYPNAGATDLYGFKMRPNGERYGHHYLGSDGNFININGYGFIWQSVEYPFNPTEGGSYEMAFDTTNSYIGGDVKNNGFGIRLIRDI